MNDPMHTWIVTLKPTVLGSGRSRVRPARTTVSRALIMSGFEVDRCRYRHGGLLKFYACHTDRTAMTKFVLVEGSGLRPFEYEENICTPGS
jgi:hypothetical protein